MLQPKRTKFRKQFKGRIHGTAKGGTDLAFGGFGLKALEVSEGGHQFRAFFRRARLARHVMLRCGEGVATSALPVHKEKVARC